MILNMGPQHPSTHGVLRLKLTIDADTITKVVPYMGYIHRGLEKLAENRRYEQFTPHPDRLDYISAMSWNGLYCQTIEKALDLHLPARVEYIRVICFELQRIANHLMFFAAYTLDLGQTTMFIYPFQEREWILDLFEQISGQRLTYNYFRIGGVSRDVPRDWSEKVFRFLDHMEKRMKVYHNMVEENEIFLARTKGIGVMKREEALRLGMLGPPLRASGARRDVRRDEPYSIYERFDFDIPILEEGDSFARYEIRMLEIYESIKIVRQALAQLPDEKIPDGHDLIKQPVKLPECEVYCRNELPKGEGAFYLISTGEKPESRLATEGGRRPYRLKIKSPAFVNLWFLDPLTRGHHIADIIPINSSLDLIFGEVDR